MFLYLISKNNDIVGGDLGNVKLPFTPPKFCQVTEIDVIKINRKVHPYYLMQFEFDLVA